MEWVKCFPSCVQGVREGAGEAAAGGGVAGQAGVVASRLRPFTTQLIQSIFRRVPAPLWTEARRRTTQRLVFGASAPYFALVGVTLVGGSHGLVTRDDELEALCGTVRVSAMPFSSFVDIAFIVHHTCHPFNILHTPWLSPFHPPVTYLVYTTPVTLAHIISIAISLKVCSLTIIFPPLNVGFILDFYCTIYFFFSLF